MWGHGRSGPVIAGVLALLLVIGCAEQVPTGSTDPDTARPTAASEVSPTDGPPADASSPDLEAGWVLDENFTWTVQPGCCGMDTVGPTSPAGPIPEAGWPADGFYEARADRPAADPTVVRLTLRRWTPCDDLDDGSCAPDPGPDPATGEDRRMAGDPTSEVVREVPVGDLRVILVPIHDLGAERQRALEGGPGAFALLLTEGIDVAYRTCMLEPLAAGRDLETVRRELLDRSTDPSAPFGVDYDPAARVTGPLAYRGPLGTSLLVDPAWGGWARPERWPPGPNGLYGWRTITLEVRDGAPVLHLWAGPIAG
jgi:hypothetical protein